jgi:peptidyl-prolyl cis-trans isomerase SurA
MSISHYLGRFASIKRYLLVLGIVLAPTSAIAAAAPAESLLIDRIIAVVEDEAIFQSDVEQLVKQYTLQQGAASLSEEDRTELFQRLLLDLINDKLVIAQAGRLDLSVPFSEVEQRVGEAIAENTRALGGEEAFSRQLEREGFTMESLKQLYREQIRNRMLVQRVLEIEIRRSGADIEDDDLRQFYEERKAQLPQRPAVVRLRTIFIGFDTSEQAKNDARAKVEELHRRLMAGEAFGELAKAHSDDPSATLGGDLGFVTPGDLVDPAFSEATSKLDVGEISDPVLTGFGYHIIQVTEKNPDSNEVRVRHILVRLSADEDNIQEVYTNATNIHRQILDGASFEELADKYSTDPSASTGGDLGWLRAADLPEFFQDVLAGMKPGDVSQVLRESAGFRIVKLVETEEERPYEYEEVKPELRKLYERERMEETYTEYIESLRKKFVVELR